MAVSLDLPHFHLVFTLPAELRFLAKQYPANFYGAFFRAVTQTLLKLFRTRLKAIPGLMLVLHTWTREDPSCGAVRLGPFRWTAGAGQEIRRGLQATPKGTFQS